MLTQGNPSAFTGKTPPPHVPSKRAELVHWAQWSVLNMAWFEYHMDAPKRSEMFHRKLGVLPAKGGKIRADCSQWYASICNGCGIHGLTDTDYTGTLLEKGKLVKTPKPGDCVIFGGGTGEHAAMVTFNGYTIGFGHSPGAPDRVLLTDLAAWFAAHGHPGVRYLQFVP